MSAVAWTHWDEAFLAAEKEPEKRLTFTLTPALYEKALVSLASEYGVLLRSDPRYQEACRSGRLEWWDGRGRCVVLVREESVMKRVYAEDTAAKVEASRTRPEFPPPPPSMPGMFSGPKAGDAGPALDGKSTIITSVEEVRPGLTAATYETKPGKGKKK